MRGPWLGLGKRTGVEEGTAQLDRDISGKDKGDGAVKYILPAKTVALAKQGRGSGQYNLPKITVRLDAGEGRGKYGFNDSTRYSGKS